MDSHADKLIGEPIRRGKPVLLFGNGTLARNFVAADDVAALARTLLDRPEIKSETIDVGGPRTSRAATWCAPTRSTSAPGRAWSPCRSALLAASPSEQPFHPGASRAAHRRDGGDRAATFRLREFARGSLRLALPLAPRSALSAPAKVWSAFARAPAPPHRGREGSSSDSPHSASEFRYTSLTRPRSEKFCAPIFEFTNTTTSVLFGMK